VRSRPSGRVTLAIERPHEGAETERRHVELDVAARPGIDVLQDTFDVGWLGLQHERQKAVVGVTEAASPAARAGLRSGDRVVTVAGTPVEDWNGFADAYAAAGAAGTVALSVERGTADAEKKETVAVEAPALGSADALGVIPAVVLVAAVTADSAASDAGLVPGDLIVALDGKPIGSFATFQETVFASKGTPLTIQVAREGQTRTVKVAPRKTKSEQGGDEVYRIGITGENAVLVGTGALYRELNPLIAIPRAAQLTWERTVLFLRAFKKLVLGQIPRNNLGGPIEIARQSHLALQRGFQDFLHLVVLISINLGILNLLPIPILDGGQALVYTVEAVKRGPLSQRTREIVQQVGLVFLVMIMGFAFWNDFARNWSSFVEWLKNLT
jgi:regulator of sigma E protease